VPVSDRSAWALPSALPTKSGLSSRDVTATNGHPVFSLAQIQYRKPSGRMQEAACSQWGDRSNREAETLRGTPGSSQIAQ
ncbi:MAG TPA: hypothetical protein VLD60_14440, partial [Nitrospira sp.]|nr:hypothetical protein [Nitrospira sp.]